MIQLIFSSVLGLLLLVALYRLARRGSSNAKGGAQALIEAHQALNALQADLLPPELIERIFAKADFEYVSSVAPKTIQSLFLDQRKQIALSWINQVRRQIQSLRKFHRGSARYYSNLSFRKEIMLASHFAGLLLAARVFQLALYLRGPYAAPRMGSAMADAALKACHVSEKSLSFLRPTGNSGLGKGPAGGEAPV